MVDCFCRGDIKLITEFESCLGWNLHLLCICISVILSLRTSNILTDASKMKVSRFSSLFQNSFNQHERCSEHRKRQHDRCFLRRFNSCAKTAPKKLENFFMLAILSIAQHVMIYLGNYIFPLFSRGQALQVPSYRYYYYKAKVYILKGLELCDSMNKVKKDDHSKAGW